MRAVVDAKAIGGHAGSQELHRLLGEAPRHLGRSQHHRCRAVADGRAIVQADGRADDARGHDLLDRHLPVLKEGIGIVRGIGVGVDRKMGEGVAGGLVLLEIELHQHRILAD